MGNSNIRCIHIHEIGCLFYDDARLCPDKCPGFVAAFEEPAPVEKTDVVEPTMKKRI